MPIDVQQFTFQFLMRELVIMHLSFLSGIEALYLAMLQWTHEITTPTVWQICAYAGRRTEEYAIVPLHKGTQGRA